MTILADHKKLIYSGRIDWSNPLEPIFVFPCTFVKMKFTGNVLKVHVKNRNAYWNNYLGVLLDGEQSSVLLPKDGEALLDIPFSLIPLPEYPAVLLPKDGEALMDIPVKGSEKTEHEVMIFKRQDSCHELTFLGFELGEGAEIMDSDPLPERRIEVYGDSVSAGEVSEAVDYTGKEDPEHNGEYSNSWYSYAWMTARRLNAQIHDIAQGGIALRDHTGWFYEPEAIGMETAWNKIHYNPLFGNATEWDFSKYTPQVVIVAIGQNDNHPDDYMKEDYNSERSKQWREHYKAFIEGLKKQYPEAKIVCCTTLLCHDESWDRSIGEVVKELDHPDITQCLFTRNGKGTPGHLRIPEAEEMSQELADYIEKLNVKGWEK